ncbi:hypothetical protein ADICYQ_0012 [Cyclobacterium qasimii M12-11B]|uniref:Uncharacterized protein n=1 Tax=Cyclobacterium qasimii M12-11B TaxID=641524 RepID=S7WYC6_9BACT|nr:hypothetical protein ADICYQ_0012 [Cyclobacterium qasimii M12-11B]
MIISLFFHCLIFISSESSDISMVLLNLYKLVNSLASADPMVDFDLIALKYYSN